MRVALDSLTTAGIEGLVAKGWSVEIDADSGYADITRNTEPKNEAVSSEAAS